MLWQDAENRADDEEGGGSGSKMGDWFLSLPLRGVMDSSSSSSSNDEWSSTAVASWKIHVRLLLHLSIFSKLCLAGQSVLRVLDAPK
jgi:hypothetical protein